uniref:High mobility group protein B2 n=1 Tax=Cyclopterus lumpus TaxID=8103 RepID=A0A8C2Z9Z1_CYCLU
VGSGSPGKPRGKMSSYAYFVQTCREEHKKKHPEASVNFSEFSKKCSERWKTMSLKEKGKFEDLAKQDKVRYEREMMSYVPPRGSKKKKFKDPNAPKRPPSAFFIFCAEYRPKVKGETPGLTIGDVAKRLGEMWNGTASEDKQPFEKKAAKLKEKYEKVKTSVVLIHILQKLIPVAPLSLESFDDKCLGLGTRLISRHSSITGRRSIPR